MRVATKKSPIAVGIYSPVLFTEHRSMGTEQQTVNLSEIRMDPNGNPLIIRSGISIAFPLDQVPYIIEAARRAEDIKAGKSVSFDFASEAKFQVTVSFAPFAKKGARRDTRTYCARIHFCTFGSTHATLTHTVYAS